MAQINVTRSSLPDFDEYCEELRELWESRHITNSGVKHQKLQSMLEDHLGVKHALLFANGHMALEFILEAMDFPKGSEIITTPFTFASTTHAIVRSGYVPVFCDIEADTYTLDPTKLESLITDRTRAVLPVHVYGNICDVDAIGEIARRHGLKVIYDAAHAFGIRVNGASVAAFGDASMFSFHATKVFNTVEGGALCFNDDTLVPSLECLRNFGISGEDCTWIGGNAKMSEFHAAMGICNLRHLNEEIALRRAAAEEYYRGLEGIDGIKLSYPKSGVVPNYAYFPVVFDGYKYSRDQVLLRLADHGVMARKYFYPLTNSFSCYRDMTEFCKGDTPVAQRISENILTLPLYAGLTADEVRRICDIITN